jgi:hypothetical protein
MRAINARSWESSNMVVPNDGYQGRAALQQAFRIAQRRAGR